MSLKKGFRKIKKLPDWVYIFPAFLMKLCYRCFFRKELIDEYHICDNPRGMIGLAWHNRLLYFAPAFPQRLRDVCVAVVSASRDGQYVADFLRQFKIGALRGSSSKKGASALLEAVTAIESGKNVIFTPDGPRGPKYVIKPGPIYLASKTGAKIVPMAINASSFWSARSWDGFQFPKPGAKITLILGEPIAIPPDLTPEELEIQRQRVEQAMLAITNDVE